LRDRRRLALTFGIEAGLSASAAAVAEAEDREVEPSVALARRIGPLEVSAHYAHGLGADADQAADLSMVLAAGGGLRIVAEASDREEEGTGEHTSFVTPGLGWVIRDGLEVEAGTPLRLAGPARSGFVTRLTVEFGGR
jgi:hypothetical protein